MNNLFTFFRNFKDFTKIREFFSGDKKILLPLIPLVLFVLVFIFIVSLSFTTNPTPPTLEQIPSPTLANDAITRTPTLSQEEQNNSPYHGETILYEEHPKLEKKETLPDNKIKYTLRSNITNRPDIIVVQGEEQNDVFTRSVSEPNNIPTLSSYTDVFGSPNQIFQGSKFYGQNAQWYIYTNMKMAFVTKDGLVLEVHSFPALSVELYLSQYNDDIIK